jgi:hypothetical protein
MNTTVLVCTAAILVTVAVFTWRVEWRMDQLSANLNTIGNVVCNIDADRGGDCEYDELGRPPPRKPLAIGEKVTDPALIAQLEGSSSSSAPGPWTEYQAPASAQQIRKCDQVIRTPGINGRSDEVYCVFREPSVPSVRHE